ncbi:MAG: M3 family oligoendopeptidase [Nitrososphaerota archaeon]|jgi:oligoendopeptidase F|nr:M3 family oligoendopeptidase [Nitrososphaerota archaeon]
MTKAEQQLVTWDLSELFLSLDDPKINQAITEAVDIAAKFEGKYRGKIAELSPKGVLECLQKVEAFSKKISNVGLYASLAFAANMTLPAAQALNDRVDKLSAKLDIQLAFYHLELSALLKDKPHFISDPVLANYKHLLERVYRHVEHNLSEIEEQLIIEKDQFGVNAWEELQSKWLNTRVFDIEVMGKQKSYSYGEASGLLHHPDRATRQAANHVIYTLLGKDGEVFSSALRNICNDWVAMSRRRKHKTPMNDSLISNDTEQEIIDNLLISMEKGAKSYRRYLKLKAKLMDLPVLENYDLTAPIPGASELKFTFKQAQNLITRAYERFDPDYAIGVKEMFTKHHIDAAPRFGKRNGAFCASHYNGKSAYILQSYNGTLSDVFTLAHELGHATHDWYMARSQTPLNTNVPSIVAETASIFGELLLSDLLLAEAKTDAERRAVLCLILDEAGLAAFQVTARVWFEQALYTSIEQGEFLDYNTICKHWTTARNRIFGKAVHWQPEMSAEWTMKPHYYMANYRFYNYPYIYAQMFVYTLYQQYLTEGKQFTPKLKKTLSAGSSLSPIDLAQILQLNPKTPNFWNNGLKTFENLTKTLEKTI